MKVKKCINHKKADKGYFAICRRDNSYRHNCYMKCPYYEELSLKNIFKKLMRTLGKGR